LERRHRLAVVPSQSALFSLLFDSADSAGWLPDPLLAATLGIEALPPTKVRERS
jgi:hypothetical protein